MISVDIAKGKKGRLVVRFTNPTSSALAAVKSLLSCSYAARQQGFLISVDDFDEFHEKLETLGVEEEGEITPEAKNAIDAYRAYTDSIKQIKSAPPDESLLGEIPGWKTKPYPDQLQCIKFHISRGRSLEAGETGVGKAQPVSTLIPTPNGWRTMGDLKPGDLVFTPKGTPSKILQIFPQGKKDIYKVTFSDGSATKCCDDHLWYTTTRYGRVNNTRSGTVAGSVKTLKEIRQSALRLKMGNQQYWNHEIPMTVPVEYPKKDTLIDPYLLGVLLGDGGLRNHVTFSTADDEILAFVKNILPKDHAINALQAKYGYSITANGKNAILAALYHYDLMGKYSYEKHIPSDYLVTAVPDRIALLQGLMDTDGEVTKSGKTLLFTTTSPDLRDNMVELVQSLGGTARVKIIQKYYTHKGVKKKGRVAFRLTIRVPQSVIPFRLSRKKDKYTGGERYMPVRYITKIEQCGVEEAVCILIDDPEHLYLTENYITTHNTLVLLYTLLYWKAKGLANKSLILCLNSAKLDWESEIRTHTNLVPYVIGNGSKNVSDDITAFQKGKYDVLVMHYDCLFQDSRSKINVFDQLKKLDFQFIALDEVHILKNPSAKRHKRIVELIEEWPKAKLVCATGTAIDGNPKSAWATMKLINTGDNSYFPSYNEFYNHFVIRQPRFFYRKKVMVEVGFKNLSRLKRMMDLTSIRFLKADVMGRPSKIFQNRIVSLGKAQAELYKQIKQSIANEIVTDEGETISLAGIANRVLRLRQLVNHPSLVPGVKHYGDESAKYAELDEVVEEILSNENAQLLVWTQWRDAVDLLVKRYKDIGAVGFYGGSDDRAVRDLVLSKKARIVVAIPEKAGTSIDWLKGIRTAVFLEKPWSLSLYRQTLDRIDRRSNTDPALIISIEAAGTVDQLVNAMLQRRQDVFDAITIAEDKLTAMNKDELLKYLK